MENNKKIKILFISHSSYFYGAEQSLLCLLTKLDRDLFDILVMLPDDKGELFKKVKMPGVKTLLFSYPSWIANTDNPQLAFNILEEIKFANELSRIVENEAIDIIYTNSIVKISGAIASRLSGVPHIWHIREILESQPLNSLLDMERTFRVIGFFSDKIIANSKAAKVQFIKSESYKKTCVVYNAVDITALQSKKDLSGIRSEFHINNDCFLVGIVGYINYHKGHADLIRAFKEVVAFSENIKLLVVGDHDRKYMEELIQLIDDLDLNDHIIFTGFRLDIPSIMHSIDLLVSASLAEPFGRTIIEAMAVGKPVVSTNKGAASEIIVDSSTGYLVPPEEPSRLAQAIIKVFSEPEKRLKMGMAGQSLVSTKFSDDLYICSIQKILLKVFEKTEERKPVDSESLVKQVLEVVGPSSLIRFFTCLIEYKDLQLSRQRKDLLTKINKKNVFQKFAGLLKE